MNKKLIIAGVMAMAVMPVLAQDAETAQVRKWSAVYDRSIEGQNVRRPASKGERQMSPESVVDVNVIVKDAQAVCDFLVQNDMQADIITNDLVVATMPVRFIKELASREDVIFVEEPQQYAPLMNKVLPETGVSKVTSGEGLETPFTGKGVVLAILDAGFEYKHPAFDGRVVRYNSTSSSDVLVPNRPSRDDMQRTTGHGTHVGSIAGGGKVEGSPYMGVAPGADMVLVSTNMSSNTILRQLKAIKQYAEDNGQPWVVNMSFGGTIGPHDGTSTTDRAMAEMVVPGGLLVAAMGNDGGSNVHAERDITSAEKAEYLYCKPLNSSEAVATQVWSKANDGVAHLDITPVIYHGGKYYTPTKMQLSMSGCTYDTGINSVNKRQYASFQGFVDDLAKTLGITAASGYYLLWKVTGQPGDGFHAWIDNTSYFGEFASVRLGTMRVNGGDDKYMVGEGAATCLKAVSVASYNASNTLTTPGGQTINFTVGDVGAISNFSSTGPMIVDAPKPAIAAPGGVVVSAYSKLASDFTSEKSQMMHTAKVDGEEFYYGPMSGTSMACPVVTGVIALWLEANPTLTYDQVIEILKKTGRKDSYTGDADKDGWNAMSGYGKIDAYEGLKMALSMTGVNETFNSAEPVTLSKQADAWKVLFNSHETFADIALYNTKGALVSSKHLSSPRLGQEETVSLSGLEPGVYLFSVTTTSSKMTRKLIVR